MRLSGWQFSVQISANITTNKKKSLSRDRGSRALTAENVPTSRMRPAIQQRPDGRKTSAVRSPREADSGVLQHDENSSALQHDEVNGNAVLCQLVPLLTGIYDPPGFESELQLAAGIIMSYVNSPTILLL